MIGSVHYAPIERTAAMHDAARPLEPALLSTLRPRKVALFRASRIGDFVCATPAFRALRAALPGAEVTLIALPLVADLAARCASLDRFEPFPGMPGIADQFFDAARALEFFRRMQAERFDLAIQMHGSGVYSNPVALMLGARMSAGFVRPGDPPGRLDAPLVVPGALPEIARLLRLAEFLGARPCGEQTEFPLRHVDRRRAAALLTSVSGPLVGVHAGAREAAKRWPPERFAAVANHLASRHGAMVLVVGGRDDIPVSRRLASLVRVPCVDLSDRLDLPALGAVIERLAVLVTNDSGPAHIAYALGTPAVTVFEDTDPGRWRPLAPGPFRLLARPAVGEVAAAAEQIMRVGVACNAHARRDMSQESP